jgi:hypothetical protein
MNQHLQARSQWFSKSVSKSLGKLKKRQCNTALGLIAYGLLLNAAVNTGGIFLEELLSVGFILMCLGCLASTQRQAFSAELRAINEKSKI